METLPPIRKKNWQECLHRAALTLAGAGALSLRRCNWCFEGSTNDVVNPTTNLPCGDVLYDPFQAKFGMVSSRLHRYTKTTNISLDVHPSLSSVYLGLVPLIADSRGSPAHPTEQNPKPSQAKRFWSCLPHGGWCGRLGRSFGRDW